MGAYTVATTASSLDKNRTYLCLSPLECWEKIGHAENCLKPTWKISLSCKKTEQIEGDISSMIPGFAC